MLTVGIARVGNEPEVRFTSAGKAVMDLSLAFSYGRKGDDGKQPTQWVKASMWGDRAQKLAPYIKKGGQLYVQLSDLHIDTYDKKDGGQGTSLKAMVQDVQLIGGKPAEEQVKPPMAANGLDDLEDDIPF